MTLFNMGTLFFALELFNEALEQFEKVYSIDPANSKVLYNIGNSAVLLGNYSCLGLCNHMLMKDDIALSYYKQVRRFYNYCPSVNYVLKYFRR